MNAGVQIAQRGSLRHSTTGSWRACRPKHVDCSSRAIDGLPYYSNRFMGFFLLDPDRARLIDQFPHLYPTAIAIGYDMAGLTGARYTSTVCAVIGVLALYFLGARLIGNAGRRCGAAGLLAIHLVQVWHARIPNSEVLAQALLLAGLAGAGAGASGRRRVLRAGGGRAAGAAAVCSLRRRAGCRPGRGGTGGALERGRSCSRRVRGAAGGRGGRCLASTCSRGWRRTP